MVINKSGFAAILVFQSFMFFFTNCTDVKRSAIKEANDKPVSATDTVPVSELNMAKDPAALLVSVRSLIREDSNVAFITLDPSGRPRVRTVYTMVEETQANTIGKNTRIWIMTRASTRKVAQLKTDPHVTLYYNNDAAVKYASIMGTATVFTDPKSGEAERFLRSYIDPETQRFFWPSFPEDFALIQVRPKWVEYLSKDDAHADPRTWRPQAVVFE